jgi:single-stranded-DNA-specific exonuclease
MQALWKLIPGLSREGKVVNKQALSLAKKLDLDPLLINWLFYLGHDSEEKLHEFFYPSLKNLHNPFLMKDMSKAVARLKRAFENNEKILIIGDYDVDGTTSTALLL